MLLSWLDRLTLYVHPHRILLERERWRGASTRQQAEVAVPAAGEADWQPALAAAESLLKTSGRRGAALRIIIADHFVRYALLPWSEALSSPKARHSMALALLRNSLGDKANALEIALDKPAFGKNGIAAGIDRQLLGGLRVAAKARRLRLNRMQPRLIAELAIRHKQLDDGWFACIDSDWLTLAGLRGGEIACLHNHRASTGEAALLSGELAGLLAAESGTVVSKKLFICGREIKGLAELTEATAPTLAGTWETTLWPAIVSGDAHA